MRKNILILTLILLFSSLNLAQDYRDVLRPFNGFQASQSITAAIGNATVAAGQVIPDIGSNPANLGLHRFKILQLGFTSSEFSGNASTLPQNSMSGVQLIFPFPVYQGSFVTGFGFTRDSEFALSYKDNFSELRETGEMNSLHFSIATEFFKNVFLGADLRWITGSDQMIESYLEDPYIGDKDVYQPSYNGVGARMGILQRISPYLNWGASMDLPTVLWVEDEYSETIGNNTYSDLYKYRIIKAPSFRTGLSFFLRYVNLFYEMEWNNWQNLSISSDLINADGSEADLDINIEIQEKLKNTLSHKIGGAVHIPYVPLHLYGGYQYLPSAESGETKESISFGLTYLIQQAMSLNMTHQYYYWQYGGNDESWSQTAFSLMLHF